VTDTIDLLSDGERVGIRVPGFAETFDGTAGAHPTDRWVDFADLHPDSYSRVELTGDGSVTTLQSVRPRDPDTDLEEDTDQLVGHCILGREMGSANGELTVEWDLAHALHFVHQVGPVFGLDLTGTSDELKVGVVHNWDVGLNFVRGYSYMQNAFRSPLPYAYDPDLYYRIQGDRVSIEGDNVLADGDPLPGTGATFRGTYSAARAYAPLDIVENGNNSYRCLQAHTNQPLPTTPVYGRTPDTAYWSHLTTRRWSASQAEVNLGFSNGPFPPGVGQPGHTDFNFDNYPTVAQYTVRVVDGWYQTFFDGFTLHNPAPVPSWAVGRDGWGIHVIDNTWDEGGDWPFGIYPAGNYHFRVSKILWRPYDTPLV
jgi:hypothetical protein